MILSSLVYPLEYVGDVRPYLTIYERDFKDYNEEEHLKFANSAILGIINPFCLKVNNGLIIKTFDKWPVKLRFDNEFFVHSQIENPLKMNYNKENLTKLKNSKK